MCQTSHGQTSTSISYNLTKTAEGVCHRQSNRQSSRAQVETNDLKFQLWEMSNAAIQQWSRNLDLQRKRNAAETLIDTVNKQKLGADWKENASTNDAGQLSQRPIGEGMIIGEQSLYFCSQNLNRSDNRVQIFNCTKPFTALSTLQMSSSYRQAEAIHMDDCDFSFSIDYRERRNTWAWLLTDFLAAMLEPHSPPGNCSVILIRSLLCCMALN